MVYRKSPLIERDLAHIWHPCTQMKELERFALLEVERAEGCRMYRPDGSSVIDAISSWWCKSLGHGHPRLRAALARQAAECEHLIAANTSHRVLVELAERLAGICPGLDRVFFAGDGSCAVEIALKMSLHARRIRGQMQRTRFIALAGGYHGETCGAMSVSDLDLYRAPYGELLFETRFIPDLPPVTGPDDPLWHDCSSFWPQTLELLDSMRDTTTALIVEPVVQGAAGMRIYSPDFLRRLAQWCTNNDVHLITDEIMTGIGRTGTMLASEHAGVRPDFVCLSKGLTSGWLPFSCVLTHSGVYELFYRDWDPATAFLHSHTYSGNLLGAAVALETLKIFEEEAILDGVRTLGQSMRTAMQAIADRSGLLAGVRQIGAITAAEMPAHPVDSRIGRTICDRAMQAGVLVRPLGNTLYWTPPLTCDAETLSTIAEVTESVLTVSFR